MSPFKLLEAQLSLNFNAGGFAAQLTSPKLLPMTGAAIYQQFIFVPMRPIANRLTVGANVATQSDPTVPSATQAHLCRTLANCPRVDRAGQANQTNSEMVAILMPTKEPPRPIPAERRIARPPLLGPREPTPKPKLVRPRDVTDPNFWVGTFLFYSPITVTERIVHAVEFTVDPGMNVIMYVLLSETYGGMTCTRYVRDDLQGTFRVNTDPSPWVELDVTGDQVRGDTCDSSGDTTVPLNVTWSWFVTQLDDAGTQFEFYNSNYSDSGFDDCLFQRIK